MPTVRRAAPRPAATRAASQARWLAFARAYVEHGGQGVDAARAAGYRGAPASLRVTASRLLQRSEIQAELARLRAPAQAQLEQRFHLTRERVLGELGRLALEAETPRDRIQALKLVGTELGLFATRVQHAGTLTVEARAERVAQLLAVAQHRAAQPPGSP